MNPHPELIIDTEPAPRESVADKIRRDVQVWSELWKTPVGVALWARILLLEPGFQVALSLRIQEALTPVPVVGKLLRRIVWYVTTCWHGCDIVPGAQIGGGVFLPHPTGIVIGGDCVIGRGAHILQGVTIGVAVDLNPGAAPSRASPRIGDNVRIFAGARVFGPIRLGDGCVIGANAVVMKDVPAGRSAVGVPARVLPLKAAR